MEQFAGKSGVRTVAEETRSGSGQEPLRAQLGSLDAALGFLLLLIAATLLSFAALGIQRRGLCLALRGDTEAAAALPHAFPLRRKSSALVVGALGCFLCLAIQALRQAEGEGDAAGRRSARTNLWASILVFCAAVVRLEDLNRGAGDSRAEAAAGG